MCEDNRGLFYMKVFYLSYNSNTETMPEQHCNAEVVV